jgi:hypothetical protein
MLQQNVKGVLILRNVKQREKKVARVTYVGLRRDAYESKMHVRFRFRIIHIGSVSCRGPNPRPNIQDADDAKPLNENALVLW